jgi:hypothetical protein
VEGRLYGARDPGLAVLEEQAQEAALCPGQLEHEIPWVVDSDHGRDVSGAVLGLFDGQRLAGYVPFRYRADGLLFRVGGIRLGRLPYRTIELFGRGVVANQDHLIAEALSGLRTVPWPFHALAVQETPTESPLWQAIASGAAGEYQTLKRATTVHHVVDLPGSFEAYMAGFSAKTRSTWKRKTRKLESDCGPLRLEVFTEADEVSSMLALIEPVCRLTYHYHLMGHDLSPRNLQLVRNLTGWAQRSWLRTYVLFAGDRPVAYVVGSLSRGRYSYDMPGFDPGLSAASPGILLLLRMVEDLIGVEATMLDFGSGHADYKEMLATRSFPEVSALLVRRTPYAQGIAHLQRGVLAAAKSGTQLLDRFQVKSRVKNWVKGRRFRPV